MDPYYNQDSRNHQNYRGNSTNPRAGRSTMSGFDNPPVDSNANAPNSANAEAPPPQATPSQHSDGFTMIQPNESRWTKLKMMAQKEADDLQRWKEANRPSTVLLTPERLGGGDVSLAEARERQLTELRQAKLQKKLRKEEMDRMKRQEDEEELQKMKAKQREKAERLEERSRQEELRRRQQLRQDQLRTNENFLQKFEWTGPALAASSSATQTSSRLRAQEYREGRRDEENTTLQLKRDEQRRKGEALEEKQREEAEERRRDVQLEHRRVNSAFLDQLEGQNTGRERTAERERGREVEHLPSVCEDYRHQQIQSPGAQDPLTPVNPDPEPSSSGWAGKAGSDYDWAMMKLQNEFPSCKRAFLEDIVMQCNGDFQQAYALLSDTLN